MSLSIKSKSIQGHPDGKMKIVRPFEVLKTALTSDEERTKAIREFQELFFKSDEVLVSKEVDEVLNELAGDLEFYVPIGLHRAQDPSYFGDEKAKKLIRETLKLLEAEGVKEASWALRRK